LSNSDYNASYGKTSVANACFGGKSVQLRLGSKAWKT
jgi:hypothetical protein